MAISSTQSRHQYLTRKVHDSPAWCCRILCEADLFFDWNNSRMSESESIYAAQKIRTFYTL